MSAPKITLVEDAWVVELPTHPGVRVTLSRDRKRLGIEAPDALDMTGLREFPWHKVLRAVDAASKDAMLALVVAQVPDHLAGVEREQLVVSVYRAALDQGTSAERAVATVLGVSDRQARRHISNARKERDGRPGPLGTHADELAAAKARHEQELRKLRGRRAARKSTARRAGQTGERS